MDSNYLPFFELDSNYLPFLSMVSNDLPIFEAGFYLFAPFVDGF